MVRIKKVTSKIMYETKEQTARRIKTLNDGRSHYYSTGKKLFSYRSFYNKHTTFGNIHAAVEPNNCMKLHKNLICLL